MDTPKQSKDLYFLLFAFVSTFIFRLSYLILFEESRLAATEFPDELNYYLPAAKQIIDSGLDFLSSERSLWNGPLNPLWISSLGNKIELIKISNIFIFSLASSFLALGIKKHSSTLLASVFVLILLSFPPFFEFVPTLLTEPLYTSLLMVSLGCLLLGNFTIKSSIISGLIFGLATLARPTTQLFPVLCILFSLVFANRGFVKFLLFHGVSSILILAPLLGWNYYKFGKIGIANGSGAVLYLGNDFRRDGDEPVYSGVDFDTYQHTAPHTHLDTKGDQILSKIAFQRISNNPFDFILLTSEKIFRYILGSPTSYYYPFSDWYTYFKNVPGARKTLFSFLWPFLQVFVFVFAISSFFIKGISTSHKIYILLISIYFTGIHSVTFPIPRLYLPLFPYLLSFALMGVYSLRAKKVFYLSAISASLFILWTNKYIDVSNIFNHRQIRFSEILSDSEISGIAGLSRKDNFFIVSGSDPYFVFSLANKELSRNQTVHVSITIACENSQWQEGTGQLFWNTTESPTFTENASVKFQFNTNETEYWITPALLSSWKGTVANFRLDLPENFKSCKVLDTLKLKLLG